MSFAESDRVYDKVGREDIQIIFDSFTGMVDSM